MNYENTNHCTAIWSRRIGDTVETLAEVDGEWRIVCRENVNGAFSHIAEGNGADKWPLDRLRTND